MGIDSADINGKYCDVVAVPLDFSVEAVDSGETVRLMVRGEIDLDTVGSLSAAIAAQLDRGCRQLFLDMAGVEFCEAAGLDALLDADRTFRAVGGALTVTGCSPLIARCLRVTGLDALLRIV